MGGGGGFCSLVWCRGRGLRLCRFPGLCPHCTHASCQKQAGNLKHHDGKNGEEQTLKYRKGTGTLCYRTIPLRMSLQQETGAKPLAQGWLAKRLELPAWEQVGWVGERLFFFGHCKPKTCVGLSRAETQMVIHRCCKVFEGRNTE